jgi:trimethylamine--corrinoid protein Co-methyltransferase
VLRGGIVQRPLRLLNREEIRLIHDSATRILSRVGVTLGAKWALDLMKDAGCEVDRDAGRVSIPEHLADEAIRRSPKTVRLCGRNPRHDLELEGTRVYFAGGANAVRVVDYDVGGEFVARSATTKDLVELTVLTDALENVHCYLAPVFPQDVPPKGVDRVKCEVALNYTEKHFFHDSEGYEGAIDQIKMASTVVGGEDTLRRRPILSLAPCITSPLSWSESALGTLRACAEKRIPAIVSSETIAGATAPVTLAGSLAQQCAEVLSGLVVAHLLSPGTPTLVCTLPSVMDMRTANIVLSSIETGMMCAASAQIFREFYGIPYVGGGGISDSKIPDQQAGYEKALTLLYGALGGCNLIHLATGMLDFILSVSPEQIVIDN